MDVLNALKDRTTTRGFLRRVVSRDTITRVLLDAHRAPSASNQQPWNFFVITGAPLHALREKITLAHAQDKKAYDPSRGNSIPPEYVQRTKTLFKNMRPYLARISTENRTFIESGSYRFYDAPLVVLVTMHKNMPTSRLMDIGMAVQNLMLSAHGRGLGTCAIALTLQYADVIAAETGIPDDHDVVLSIAVGYPNKAFEMNRFRSPRDDLEGFVTFKGFHEP